MFRLSKLCVDDAKRFLNDRIVGAANAVQLARKSFLAFVEDCIVVDISDGTSDVDTRKAPCCSIARNPPSIAGTTLKHIIQPIALRSVDAN